MFAFLKNIMLNSKKEKQRLITEVENVQKKLATNNLYKVNIQLEKIIRRLDDAELDLNKEQILAIDQCLSAIGNHLSKSYESLLLNKCRQIDECISSKEAAKDVIDNSCKTEDKVLEIQGELSSIDAEINEIDFKMKDALGKDKFLWTKLNFEKNSLINRKSILQKNFSSLLNAQNNAVLADQVKEAKEFSAEIAKQNAYVDIQDFNFNAESVSRVENDVAETSEKMQESFVKNFGGDAFDYAYEKELEKKYINESGNQDCSLLEQTNKDLL